MNLQIAAKTDPPLALFSFKIKQKSFKKFIVLKCLVKNKNMSYDIYVI